MGAGASVPGAEAAKDDVFSPLTPGVSAPVAARARAASIVVKSAGDQVGQLLARIQAAPSDTAVLSKAMYKGDYRPPVTHSGELMSMNSRGKWKTLCVTALPRSGAAPPAKGCARSPSARS